MRIHKNIKLAEYTTFHIGGKARYFTETKSVEELEEAVDFAKNKKLKIFILGGGSNILVGDLGFRGLVIKSEAK
jgi:UDP-N-acetylmuramate dehydrogenase